MKRSRFKKFICVVLAVIATFAIIDFVVEFVLMKSNVYVEPVLDETDSYYSIYVNNDKYIELPDNYFIRKLSGEDIALIKHGSYLNSNLHKKYVSNYSNHDYIYADYIDSTFEGGYYIRESVEVPKVEARNISSMDIYSLDDELVLSLTEVDGILEKYTPDDYSGNYVYEIEGDTNYDVYVNFKDGLLIYYFGAISDEILKEWKKLYS